MTTTITTTNGATVDGVRIVDMPDLGAFTGGSSIVGEKSGSGRFSAASLGGYFLPLATGGTVTGPVNIQWDYNDPTSVTNTVYSALHITGNAIDSGGGGFYWGLSSDILSYSSGIQQNLAGAFTLRKWGYSPCFALYAQGLDNTGLPSSGGGNLVTCEMDLLANGLDDNTGGSRLILGLVYGRAPAGHTTDPMSIHTALAISPKPADGPTASVDRLIAAAGTFNISGLDFRNCTQGPSANAIWLSPGDRIAFDDAATMLMSGTAGTVSLTGALHATRSGIFENEFAVGTTAVTVGVALDVQGTTVGVRTVGGTFSGAAIRMGADQKFSFVATDANYLQYRAATQRIYYVVNGVDMWSVDASGNVRAKGTLTGSTTP